MATKKQQYRGARGYSNNYSRQRGYAEQAPAKKHGAGAVIAGIIFFLLAIAAAIILILEFCTAYKPSNGFKKVETAGQAETARINDLNLKDNHFKSIASGYALDNNYSNNNAVSTFATSACSHIQQGDVLSDLLLEIDEETFRTVPFDEIDDSSSYSLNLYNRDKTTPLFSLGDNYCRQWIGYIRNPNSPFVKDYGVPLNGNLVFIQICCHNFRSRLSATGFEFDSVDWNSLNVDYDTTMSPYVSYEESTDIFTIGFFYDYEGLELNLISSEGIGINFFEEPQIPLPVAPSKEGYTFTGWYLDEECTIRYEEEFIYKDTVLYAGYRINTCTLTLNANGGEPSETTVSGDYNTVPTIPAPTRTGYTLAGWKTESGQDYDTSTPLTQDLTLIAQWQINTYTLTLNGNGGEPSETTVLSDYNTVPTIPEPTRTGYTFTGWKKENGAPYNISAPLTQDLTLIAQWQINTYTLTLNRNGGELSQTTVSGEYNTVPTIPEPTRTGYNFTGWKTADGQAYNTASPLTQDLTLTAQWQIKTYTVTFIVDGIVYQTMTVEYGTKLIYVTESAEPALFALYSVDEAGESLSSDYAIDGDITVYAEEGTTAQKVKGNWKKIAVIGVCGAVLFVSACYGIAVLVAKRKKNR